MLKNMRYHREAIQSMAEGILLVCNLLEKTYGPHGRGVVVENTSNSVVITRNSQIILENFSCEDRYINEGVQLVKEAVFNMCEQMGDGSVLTALLVKGMVLEGLKYLEAGISPVYMRGGLKKALLEIEIQIASHTVTIKNTEELMKGVKAACRDYDIATMAVQAYQKISKEGVVLVKPTKRVECYMEIEEGMQIKQGYLSPVFCEKGKDTIIYHNAYILVTDKSISDFTSLLPLLEQIMKDTRPLLIISEDVTKEALVMLLHNVSRGVFKVAAIKAEGYKKRKSDLLDDIAVFTGAKILREDMEDMLEDSTLSMLGQADEIVVTKSDTTIIGGKGEKWKIVNQVKEIQLKLEDDKTTVYDKEKYRERIGRLQSGVATLYAGGRTSQEIRENKQEMETAVKAARNIFEGGMLPGGGSFLYHMVGVLEEMNVANQERYGVSLLKRACTIPFKTLLCNSGEDFSIYEDIINSHKKTFSLGYHVEIGEVVDMVSTGIMDSSIVIQMALRQAVSVVYEWLDCMVLMVSVAPDREDMELMKQGVPIMW